MPRVLLTGFCAVPGPRRAGVQLRHVIRSLTPLHSVDLLVVREDDQAYVERQGSVRVLRVPTPEADLKSQIQSFQRALKRQLEGADYDVVHCRDSWSGRTVLEARDHFDYAVVYDLTRAPIGESVVDPELDAQYGRDEEACLLAADLVLVPTAAAAKAIAGRGRPERVVVSPPGVDVDRFDWEDPPTGDVPRILYTGSIDPGRGVRVLIRAMAAIVRDVDARLVLAGPVVSPKFDQALRDGIRELGLTDKVELLGVVDHDQLPALLATATVCVVPAASDLTPNPTVVYPTKILEYMACKRAVVAPRRETVLQVVEHGRDALLFEAGDPIDLAAKVVQLLREPALRERIAAAGYERVRREFTASAARRALRAAYAVISERFGSEIVEDDQPKIEMLTDDEFEATVFEEAPRPQPDLGLDRLVDSEVLEEALAALDGGTGATAAPRHAQSDDTLDRPAIGPAHASSRAWTIPVMAAQTVPGVEEVTNVVVVPGGSQATPTPSMIASETAFVAGEIDVPTPRPTLDEDADDSKTPAVELTAEPADPDTGSRTATLARRNRSSV